MPRRLVLTSHKAEHHNNLTYRRRLPWLPMSLLQTREYRLSRLPHAWNKAWYSDQIPLQGWWSLSHNPRNISFSEKGRSYYRYFHWRLPLHQILRNDSFCNLPHPRYPFLRNFHIPIRGHYALWLHSQQQRPTDNWLRQGLTQVEFFSYTFTLVVIEDLCLACHGLRFTNPHGTASVGTLGSYIRILTRRQYFNVC